MAKIIGPGVLTHLLLGLSHRPKDVPESNPSTNGQLVGLGIHNNLIEVGHIQFNTTLDQAEGCWKPMTTPGGQERDFRVRCELDLDRVYRD